MNDIREALDNISTNFIEMNKDHIYMKQKITDFYKTNRNIYFKFYKLFDNINGHFRSVNSFNYLPIIFSLK